MTKFVASIRVYLDEHGGVVWAGGSENGEPKQKVTQAFREFFQAERDSELGRWRSKKLPHFVVYPSQENADHERAFGAGLDCVILRETDGAMKGYVSAEDEWPEGRGGGNEWRLVGREWFAAHPEPKPWHDAKPGEVWMLKLDVIDAEYAYVRTDGLSVTNENGDGWKNLTPNVAPSHMGLTAPTITAGRRIWPEVSHD